MNFKTTIALIALLAVAGVVLYFTREKPQPTAETTPTQQQQGTKLFDFAATEVNKVVVTPSDGKPMTLERDGMNWRLTQPVAAPADAAAVDGLVSALVELTSRSKVDAGGQN